jgi:putative DNA primase/helicase
MTTNGAEEIAHTIENASDAAGSVGLNTFNVQEFLNLTIPPREFILDPILRQKDLAMLYSWRGVGKTYLALSMAYAIASGTKFLRWTVPSPRRVLYIDGEMPASTMQERLSNIKAASKVEPQQDYFRIVTPDAQDVPIPNLLSRESQELVDSLLLRNAEVVVFDSISTLFRGGRENEAESWLPAQEWALQLRRRGLTVIFLHHEGKGGAQRGTSRREDVLDTVIQLVRPHDYHAVQGARFELRFEKARATFGDAVQPLEATLLVRDGRAEWSMSEMEDCKLAQAVVQFKIGLSVRAVGKEIGVSKSEAQRLHDKAKHRGLLRA